MSKKWLAVLLSITCYYYHYPMLMSDKDQMINIVLEAYVNNAIVIPEPRNVFCREKVGDYPQNTFFTLCRDSIDYSRCLALHCLINKKCNNICALLIRQEYKNIVNALENYKVTYDLDHLTRFKCEDKKLVKNQLLFYTQYDDVLRLVIHERELHCSTIIGNLVDFFIRYEKQPNDIAKHAFASKPLYQAVCMLFAKMAGRFFAKSSNKSFDVHAECVHLEPLCINGFTITHACKDSFCHKYLWQRHWYDIEPKKIEN